MHPFTKIHMAKWIDYSYTNLNTKPSPNQTYSDYNYKTSPKLQKSIHTMMA